MINYSEDSDRGSVMMKNHLLWLIHWCSSQAFSLKGLYNCPSLRSVRTSICRINPAISWPVLTPGRWQFPECLDVDLFSIINSNLLIIKVFCQYFVDKKFELRSEVSDKSKSLSAAAAGFCFWINSFRDHERTKWANIKMCPVNNRTFLSYQLSDNCRLPSPSNGWIRQVKLAIGRTSYPILTHKFTNSYIC